MTGKTFVRRATLGALFVLCSLVALASSASEPKVYFAYRSFLPEYETMKRFASVGVHEYCLFPSNTNNSLGEPYSQFPPVWRGRGLYDWDSLYRQFDEIIAFDPDARFLCMVDLNSPQWLARSIGDGDGPFDSFTDLANCLCNPNWIEETKRWQTDFLQKTEERYGDRIDAYILACGQTDEWMDYSGDRPNRAKIEAYKNWEKESGLPALPYPTLEEFDSSAFQSLGIKETYLRDPQKERGVIQATRFQQELIANSILDFAKLARETIAPEREIGVFFGYILELNDWRGTGCGHLAYERVVKSDLVDFFISPGTYMERPIGGGSGAMIPNATVLLSNKRRMHETDHRTTGYNFNLNEFVKIPPIAQWRSEDEDVAGLRRELCLALTDKASIWFFDMWGGNYRTERAVENVATMKRVWDENVGKQGESAAEILIVADPQSLERSRGRGTKVGIFYGAARRYAIHAGAPIAVCSFNDLAQIDLSRIKLAIFPGTTYLPPERRAILRDRLLRDGRTVLWSGPAGCDDGESIDFEAAGETIGVEFGTKGPTVVDRVGFFGEGIGKWRSASVVELDLADSNLIRRLAREAGATIYVEDDSPVYATDRLVAIHSKEGGVKRITLPRKVGKVVEAFSQQMIAENVDAFEYDFHAPETALFILEP